MMCTAAPSNVNQARAIVQDDEHEDQVNWNRRRDEAERAREVQRANDRTRQEESARIERHRLSNAQHEALRQARHHQEQQRLHLFD